MLNEIEIPTGWPKGYMQLCVLGQTQENIQLWEKEQILNLRLEEKLEVLLRRDYWEILDELIFTYDIVLGEEVTAFYEKFKYDQNFKENKTSHRLELLILNHDLEQNLQEKDQSQSVKI